MLPTFISGIFLSNAINILTNSSSRSNIIEMLSMGLMLISSILFFVLASKTHDLQAWYNALPEIGRTDEAFLNDTDVWYLGKHRYFFKNFLIYIPFLAWTLGIFSFVVYLFGQCIIDFIPKAWVEIIKLIHYYR